jgi:hypothetical protein
MQTKRNIAARAGRWSAKHRKIAIAGAVAYVRKDREAREIFDAILAATATW